MVAHACPHTFIHPHRCLPSSLCNDGFNACDDHREKYHWIDDNRLFLQRLSDPAPIALTERVTSYETLLAWSPDGAQIALITTGVDAVSRLVIVTLSNPPTQHDLAAVERLPLDTPGRPPRSQLFGSQLAWSPDGRQLLLDRDNQILRFDLINATSDVLLTRGRHPAWSPDGGQIAFVRAGALLVADADGSAARELVAEGAHPVWSPDGAWIAFLTVEGVAVVRPDGSGRRLIVPGTITPVSDSNATSYTWSPDSRQLAVLEDDRENALFSTNVISVVRVADGQARRLIVRGVNRAPTWRPALPSGDFRKAGGP